MKLKKFLEKWEWIDLDDADSVLQWVEKTFIEQEKEIIELKRKNQTLEQSEIRADERKKVCQQIKELIDPIFRQDVIALRHDIEDIIDKIEGEEV